MEIGSVEVIRHPLDAVFGTFRDRLPDIVGYIPNVSRIDVVDRTDHEDGRVSLVNHWHALADVPAALRAIIPPERIGWIDRATWTAAGHTVRWELEPFFFKENVRCGGVNHFVAIDGNRTELRIEGTLEIDAADIALVPKPLRKRVGKEIERFIGALIGPNLGNAAKGVDRYLSDQG